VTSARVTGTREAQHAATAQPLLKIDSLATAYGASQVLFGIGLTVRCGEVATLLGRNGMGKTTTVRSVMGMTPPRSGTIVFRDEVNLVKNTYREARTPAELDAAFKRATHEVRAGHQPEDRESSRPHDPGDGAGTGGSAY